jgi:SNF2 family DNA or RNA helicase
MKSPSFKAL